MSKKYSHLTEEKRDLLSVLVAEGKKKTEIAKILSCDRSTIYRELNRNGPPIHKRYYLPHKAHERAVNRKSQAHQRSRLKNQNIRDHVKEKIKLGWSPEQIAGRLKKEKADPTVSYEAIYQYVYTEAPELIKYLPRKHQKRYPKGHSRKHCRSHIPSRISIEKRPKHIEKRKQAGHWEGDTIVSKQSTDSLQIVVERKTRITKLSKLHRRTSKEMSETAIKRLKYLPQYLRRSITFDNGSENVDHLNINKALGTKSYFCVPYHSWEKATVENTAGLVRRFFPKKTNFALVSHEEIELVEYLLNNRPRKCLNYATPSEALNSCVALTP